MYPDILGKSHGQISRSLQSILMDVPRGLPWTGPRQRQQTRPRSGCLPEMSIQKYILLHRRPLGLMLSRSLSHLIRLVSKISNGACQNPLSSRLVRPITAFKYGTSGAKGDEASLALILRTRVT